MKIFYMNNKLIIIAILAVAIYFLTRKKDEPQKREAIIKKPLPIKINTAISPRINPNAV